MMRYLLPLVALASAVGGVWALLQTREGGPGDAFDTWLLALIAVTYGVAALVMLVATRRWSLRSLGLFGTFVADAWVWGAVSLSRWDVLLAQPLPTWAVNLFCALFVVSAPLLLIALMRWLIENRPGQDDAETAP